MIEPLYGFAFSPTIVQSNSVAVNVFPTQVVLSIDCRMLAGHDETKSRARCAPLWRGVDAQWELEWINVDPRQLLPVSHAAIGGHRTVLRRHVPDAELGNTHYVGFTDSHWLRAAYPDVVAYDLTPISRKATPTCRPGRTTSTSASSCETLLLRRSSRSRSRWSC